MMRRARPFHLCAMIALAAVVLSASPAMAAVCSVSPQSLAFGSYDTFSTAPTDSAATITITCDSETAFEITLGPGTGSYAARQMPGTSDMLAYNLYIDPQRVLVWGDGTGGTSTVSAVVANGVFTVYGRAFARQNLTPGSYADIISVTITY